MREINLKTGAKRAVRVVGHKPASLSGAVAEALNSDIGRLQQNKMAASAPPRPFEAELIALQRNSIGIDIFLFWAQLRLTIH